MKSIISLLVLALLSAAAAPAQTVTPAQAGDIWSALPDSDVVAVVNVPLIRGEAAARIFGLETAERLDFNSGLDEIRANTGVEVARVSRVVIGGRATGDSLEHLRTASLVILIEGGGSYKDATETAQRRAKSGFREEAYRSHRLLVLNGAEAFGSEVPAPSAMVSLTPDLMAVGDLEGIRRAVDAFEMGKEPASPELVSKVRSIPGALVTVAARVPAGLRAAADTGAPDRLYRLLSSARTADASLSLNQTGFPLRIGLQMETVASAAEMRCMLESLRTLAMSFISEAAIKKMLDGLDITADGETIMVRTEFSDQAIRNALGVKTSGPVAPRKTNK